MTYIPQLRFKLFHCIKSFLKFFCENQVVISVGGHLIKENMVMYPRNDYGIFLTDDFLDSII